MVLLAEIFFTVFALAGFSGGQRASLSFRQSSTPSRRRDVSGSQPLTSHSRLISSHRPQVLYTIYSWAPKPEPVSSIHACQPEM